jgi:chromosome segregation ATPase
LQPCHSHCHCLPRSALQENERLLELLGHMDSERTRLSRERQELLAELAQLRGAAAAAAPGTCQGSSTADHGAGESAAAGNGEMRQNQQQQEQQRQRQARLEGELQQERQLRQQAERDFRELLGSLDLLQSASPASNTCGSLQQREAGSTNAAAAAAGELQVAVSQLQQENEQLRGELQRTQGSMQGLQAGYSAAAAASSSLQHIARGLHSMSSGGGGSSMPDGRGVGSQSWGGAQGRGSGSTSDIPS